MASELSKEPSVLSFANNEAWEQWLAKNYTRQEGIWLQFFKKGSGIATITYDEALDRALCYGWIDGQLKRFDEKSYLQKFTPRRARSMWSKRNRERAEWLVETGLMHESGLKAIETAKRDGRWDAAYDKPSDMAMPSDFMQALAKIPKAAAFFETLNKANTYAIAWRLQTAKKPETRQKRFDDLLAMLARGEKLH
ncbi:conserved hypothetical protein [candidate division TM7 genomosp. GTL1]|nr:conserved hypothetical protein [candidate division TM7 genomosp. GTL1]